MRASLYNRGFQFAGALISLCLVVTGCSTISGGSKLHKSAKGSVQLEEVADWSFEASHPVIIDHLTMLKIVKGVTANDAMMTSAKMPASGSKPMRVFSDEDAEFLAPLLAQGLSQAKPEQIVGFTVFSSAGSGAEPTAGTLYVRQGSIHLTIASASDRKATGFTPGSVVRIEKAPSFAAAGAAGAMTMVIDYQALARAPMPAAIPVAAAPKPMQASPAPAAQVVKPAPKTETAAIVPAPAAAAIVPVSAVHGSQETTNDELLNKKMDELRQARETNKLKESEIAILKKENEWMKRELRERKPEAKAVKAKKTPAAKKNTAELYPSR